MKNFVLLASSVFSIASFGIAPNSYNCEGAGNTRVNYTTTSLIGRPTINVEFEGKHVKLPFNIEIKRSQSPMGTLVSVSDMRMVPVDGPEVRYTLVVPKVELNANAGEKFETMLIKTTVANPFFRPTPFSGTVERNEFVPVRCEAERLFF